MNRDNLHYPYSGRRARRQSFYALEGAKAFSHLHE